MSGESDETLMLAFQRSGDLTAFDLLYARWRTPLMRFVLRIAGDLATAEEVSQQTWLQLLETAERGSFRAGRTSFRAYLFAMARNRFIDDHVRRADAARTQSVESPEVLEAAFVQEDAALEGAAADERRDGLVRALSALPLEQREVLAMWSSGMSADEVAQATGAPRNTVLSRKRYGLKKLEGLLRAAGWGTGSE